MGVFLCFFSSSRCFAVPLQAGWRGSRPFLLPPSIIGGNDFEIKGLNPKTRTMKKLVILILFLTPTLAHAQTEKLWEKSYLMGTDNYEIKGMKLDKNENLYLYGHKADTLFLQKQDNTGNVLWTLNHHSSGYKESIIKDIVITDSFVFALSHVVTTMQEHYVALLKYTTDGDSIWFRKHYDPSVAGGGLAYQHNDFKRLPAKLELDAHKNIYGYYTGWATTTPLLSYDILTIKYTSEGQMLWTRGTGVLYSGVKTKRWLKDVHFENGTSYILGDIMTAGWLKSNPLIIRSDTSGNVDWYQYEGRSFAWNFSVGYQFDKNHIYLITETKDTTPGRIASSCIKYSKTGNRLWRKDIHYSSTSEDTPVEIFIGDSSNLFITSLTVDSATGAQTYSFKLDSSGAIVWFSNSKSNSLTNKIELYADQGSKEYMRLKGTTLSFLNSENDLLTLWVDSLKNPTHTDKVLTCGKHLWNKVADSSCIPMYLKQGSQSYYAIFYHGYTIITSEFRDTTENSNVPLLSASAVDARKVELNWSSSALPVDSVKIERSTDNNNFLPIVSKPSIEETYTDLGLTPNTTYYYRAFSKDVFRDYCPIAYDTASTWDNVGIHQTNKNTILLFPNPVKDYLHLQIENAEQVEFRILDLQGKLVQSGSYQDRIDCTSLPSGVYLIETETPIKKYVPRKFIKL